MKSTVIKTLLLFSILSFGQNKESYQEYYDSLMTTGNYDELIVFFNKELEKHPKSEDILRSIGFVHIAKNNLDLGEKYYFEALSINPKCARCYMNIGRVHALRGNNEKALEFYQKAINVDPNDALLYATRALTKEKLGDKFGALRDHDQAIKSNPQNPDYYIYRAEYNGRSGYPSLALADFSKAIELGQNQFNPLLKRAMFYYEQKRFEEALKDINQALAIDSNQFVLYNVRGSIFSAMNDHRKAINDYNKAIFLNKNVYLLYLNRANSFYQMENLDASCNDYFTVNTLLDNGIFLDQQTIDNINTHIQEICDSSYPSFYYQRGIGFYNLDEFQKALNIYTSGLLRFPNHAMMLNFKGNAHLKLYQFEKAIDCFKLSLQFKESLLEEVKENPRFNNAPDDVVNEFFYGSIASTHFNISKCLASLGQYNEALEEINLALKTAPLVKGLHIEDYYDLKGSIQLMKGNFEQAILEFDQSIDINSNMHFAYINRAIAKVRLQEKVKTKEHILQGNFMSQHLNIKWNSLKQSSLEKSESGLLSALADCNRAIEINNNFDYAYYIRGQIKLLLNQNDYCFDLLTAKELGYEVEEDLILNCL